MISHEPATWSLNPQLERDTIAVGDLALCQIRLMNDATYPWLVLVPRRHEAVEITDLDEVDQTLLIREIAQAVGALKAETACDKVNVAAIGNIVAQLHVHVVARFRADSAWPKPVWGHAPARAYAAEAAHQLTRTLRARLY